LPGCRKMPDPLQRQLAFLNPDYTVSRYPNAANGIPDELYDRETALSKIGAAEEVIEWLQKQIRG